MAKATNSPAPAADLNADPGIDDLNAGGTDLITEPSVDDLNMAGDPEVRADDEREGPEFVVLKGNSVRHNGEVYRENSVIPVTGQDAERLLQAGIIADVSVLRQRVLAAQPSVTVTSG